MDTNRAYDEQTTEDAVIFMEDNQDIFVESIIEDNGDNYRWQGNLCDIFHESITDECYDPEEAVFVLGYCNEKETDSGLWEGQDPEDAISTQAAFSYANDVRTIINGFFKGICDELSQWKEDNKYGVFDDDGEDEKKAVEIFNNTMKTLKNTPAQMQGVVFKN